jgi:hypothetical protein
MARCSANHCNRWRPGLLQHVSGVTISDRWFCSRTCVEQMAHDLLNDVLPQPAGIPGLAPSRLGTLLRHYRALTSAQLDEALSAQRETRLPLGAQLLALNLVGSATIVRALAAQAGVRYLPFVDPDCVRSAPGGLSRDAVRALGLVPFSEVSDDGRIKVACVAPLPRAALTALHRLTSWTPEPYLVSDANLDLLRYAYGADAAGRLPAGAGSGFVRASTLSEAAACIATAATSARRSTMTEASLAQYTWVRVRGAGVTQDVLFAPAGAEEIACQAAATSR